MECFHSAPVIVDATGTRFDGREEVKRHYETGFALMPNCAAISASSAGIQDAAWPSPFSTAHGRGTGK